MRGKWTSGALALLLTCGAGIAAQDRYERQLTRARLHYTRGQLSQAEHSLRGVIENGNDTQKQRAQQLLSQLHGAVLVEARQPQDPQPGGSDPIDALIAVLNSGSQGRKVLEARNELRGLGGLIVPHLLEAFPKLGPFGVQNVLEVLRYQDDPRITAMLSQQVEQGRPEIVAAIVSSLTKLHRSVSRPLAQRFAADGQPDAHRLAALAVMLKDAPESATCRQLERDLLASDVAETRGNALSIVVVDGSISQARALEILQTLPGRDQIWRPLYWAKRHPDWVELATFAARALIADPAGRDYADDYVENFEWQRGGDAGAAILLDLEARFPDEVSNEVYSAVSRIIRGGWQVPPAMEDRLFELLGKHANNGMYLMIDALPRAGERRALGLWERHEVHRKAFVDAAVGKGRRWHRLAAKHLLSLENAWEIDKGLVGMDWRDAPPEALADLRRFTARWPTMPVGISDVWVSKLVAVYESYDEIDLATVEPQLRGGNAKVWKSVARREPVALLRLAADFAELSAHDAEMLAQLLPDHGTERDLPLALRLMASPIEGRGWQSLATYAKAFGQGSLEMLQLTMQPRGLHGHGRQLVKEIRFHVTRRAHVADLVGYLKLMPELEADLQQRIWDGLRGQIEPAHVAPLGAALQALAAADWKVPGEDPDGNRSGNYARCLVSLLRESGSEAAIPFLRAVLQDEQASDTTVRWCVAALLELDGAGQRDLYAELLRSKRLVVAIAALDSDRVRDDFELRELALVVVLRSGPSTEEARNVFAHLRREDQLAFAKAVLEHERMPSFRRGLVYEALRVYAGSKDATYLPQMRRAARHQDNLVRAEAAGLMGRTFTREAVEPLLDMLKDDDAKVRSTAQESLDMIANYLEQRETWEQRFRRK